MSFKEFIKYYYFLTDQDFPIEDYRVGMRRYEDGRVDKKHRRSNIVIAYFSMLCIAVFSIVLFINKELLFGMLTFVAIILIYFLMIKVERFSILYYLVCWIRHKDQTFPQALLNKLVESNLPHEHFIASNNKVVVLERLSDKSILKMKYLAFQKGQIGQVKIIIGKKVIVCCKEQKYIIKCENKDYQELITEIADVGIESLEKTRKTLKKYK